MARVNVDVKSGRLAGQSFTLNIEEGCSLKIGRHASSEIHFPEGEDSVSTRHAELILSGGVLYVEDKNSTNGTFLNGERLAPLRRTALPDGSKILLSPEGPSLQVFLAGGPSQVKSDKPPISRDSVLRHINEAVVGSQDQLRGQVQEVDARARKAGSRSLIWGLAAIFVVFVVAVVLVGIIWFIKKRNDASLGNVASSMESKMQQLNTNWAEVTQEAQRATVRIKVEFQVKSQDVLLDQGTLLGTGFVVDSSGFILTNRHVVDVWSSPRATAHVEGKVITLGDIKQRGLANLSANVDYWVQFPGKEWVTASFIKSDTRHDLAMIKIQIPGTLPVINLAPKGTVPAPNTEISIVGYPWVDASAVRQRTVADEGIAGHIAVSETAYPIITRGIVAQATSLSSADSLLNITMENGSSGSPIINSLGQCIGVAYRKSEVSAEKGGELNYGVPLSFVYDFLESLR
jgi:S1-C subfamily serine protease